MVLFGKDAFEQCVGGGWKAQDGQDLNPGMVMLMRILTMMFLLAMVLSGSDDDSGHDCDENTLVQRLLYVIICQCLLKLEYSVISEIDAGGHGERMCCGLR